MNLIIGPWRGGLPLILWTEDPALMAGIIIIFVIAELFHVMRGEAPVRRRGLQLGLGRRIAIVVIAIVVIVLVVVALALLSAIDGGRGRGNATERKNLPEESRRGLAEASLPRDQAEEEEEEDLEEE